jgi:hypothetical protein
MIITTIDAVLWSEIIIFLSALFILLQKKQRGEYGQENKKDN